MQDNNCIFCKIIKGVIPSIKIWEDQEFMAILDINPNTEGMTLVLTKNHYDSYIFEMPEDIYSRFMTATKKVAKILEDGLNVKRVALVMEGMGVNHAHNKLYPMHKIGEKFEETWAKDKIYFEKYEGFISTQLGPQKSAEELKRTAKKILDNTKNKR